MKFVLELGVNKWRKQELNHDDLAELLAKLEQSEAEAAKLRDKLKAILEQALLK